MSIYNRFADLARRQLVQKGGWFVYTTTSAVSFDAETGEFKKAADAETSVPALWPQITQSWKDQFPIQTGDAVALVPSGYVQPKPGDLLDGWTIVNVSEVRPATVTIVYKLHLRRG